MKEQMQYCVSHREEIDKIANVKAQADEVKEVTVEINDKLVATRYTVQRVLANECMWNQDEKEDRDSSYGDQTARCMPRPYNDYNHDYDNDFDCCYLNL
ncbi:hypothetical protein E3N88_32571 [Mikania micrantha]|uniref:Uncharacterized protein n=1 Tax=Mikania micrantha TaxID=192012 RepID=A0A5N6MA45_9ASTR|nr:hypothetical protein E3N88_32571 [Mikania micrantha]